MTPLIHQDRLPFCDAYGAGSRRCPLVVEIAVCGVVGLGLYLCSLYSFLLFHILAELFSIIIAMAVFMFVFNTRRYVKNDFWAFLGLVYFFIGAIDILHTLAYSGMNVFSAAGVNLSSQMWLAARYLEATAFLAAPLFLTRRLSVVATGSALTVAVGLIIASIFYWRIFPLTFVEGVGLTPFKIVSEYLISLLLLAAAGLFYKKRTFLDRDVYWLIIFSMLTTVLSEMVFTLYTDPYGSASLVGHFAKILSFYLIYKAIIHTGLQKPYALLFHDLQEKKEALVAAKVQLEDRVRARTADLVVARDRLQQEVREREGLIAKIRASEKELDQYRLKLEEKVQERTLKLEERTVELEKSQMALRSLLEDVKEVQEEVEEKNRVLERFNKVMVGRELRMVELKNEIRGLRALPGQDVKAVE